MTEKELIRAEIARYIREEVCSGYSSIACCRDLLKFIDSLPEEKPSEDLADAAKTNTDELWRLCSWQPNWDDLHESFIAGAEWQEKQDLKWAGEIHKNGYNLCKEQMMKDAVEGVVYRYESYKRIATAIIVDIPRETLGNRVKLIIVKED